MHHEPPPSAPVRHRIRDDGVGRMLIDYVSDRFDTVTRKRWLTLIRQGRFELASAPRQPLEAEMVLAAGDTLVVRFPEGMLQSAGMMPAPVDLPLVFQDDDLVVVNKAAGVLSYPQGMSRLAAKRYAQRWAVARDGGCLDDTDLRPLHRLDKETSGVLMFAKNLEADRAVKGAFERRSVAKTYLAIVVGWPAENAFSVTAPIGPDEASPIRVRHTVRGDGAAAETHIRVLERFGRRECRYSWVAVAPRTGRTHQIRVHLAHYGTPIVGDKLYIGQGEYFAAFRGSQPTAEALQTLGMRRQALHAHRLDLAHPRTGTPLCLVAAVGDDMWDFARSHGSAFDIADDGVVEPMVIHDPHRRRIASAEGPRSDLV